MAERINRCVKVTRDLLQKLGRQPTIPEIAKEMKLSISKVVELLSVAQEPSSLEAPVGEEGEDQLGDLIEDKTTLSPSDTVFLTMLQEQMDDLLNSTLSQREKKILELRFGLKGNKPHTLNEIGDILNITRERVRQLEMRSLKKLRELEISSELHEILEESS
jgi:RNA polymerase primary sigma factor